MTTRTILCAAGHTWERERQPGRLPRYCPEHANQATARVRTCEECGTSYSGRGRRRYCDDCGPIVRKRLAAARGARQSERAKSERWVAAGGNPRLGRTYSHECPRCGESYESGSARGGVPSAHSECARAVKADYMRDYSRRRAAAGTSWREQNPERRKAHGAERRARLAARTDEQRAADLARLRPDGTKRCPKCLETRPVGEFYASVHGADGLRTHCASCDDVGSTSRRAARARLSGAPTSHDDPPPF